MKRLIIKKHKETGLLVRSDGAVYMRIRHSNNYQWTLGSKNNYGYMIVQYKGKIYRVHRLVADCFIDNSEGKPTVDHINQIRNDNRVENLRWATTKEQQNFNDQDVQKKKVEHTNYTERTAKMDYKAIANKVAVKLSKTVLQFTLDDKLVKEWSSTRECGRNGFAQSNVAACCRGERKTAYGYKWRYA